MPEQPAFWQRMKNRWGNAKDIAVGGMTDAFEKGLTHNSNKNGWGNAAEVGNAVIDGLGSAIGGGWELLGGNDAMEGLGVARDTAIMLELNRASPETQLSEVDWLVQGKLGYDGLKESYERWEAENPNAAEVAGLGWNFLENVLTKGKGNDKLNAKGKNNSLSAKPDIKKISDKYLEQKGFDAHQIKADFLGTSGSNAHYDLYVDNKTKEIMIYKKGGKGEGIGTGQYIK